MKLNVNGESGRAYSVDTKEITCTCPHFKYRLRHFPAESERRLCKHLRQVFEEHPELSPLKRSNISNTGLKDADGKVRYPRSIFSSYITELNSVVNQFSNIIDKYEICGSYRRLKETVSDLDVLIVLHEGKSPDSFLNYLEEFMSYLKLWRGDKKASYKIDGYIQIDFKFVPIESWPFATLHFTGSKYENIEMRRRAISMGYSLNEYGLTRESDGSKITNLKSERDIYEFLGIPYKEPYER
jgi:DNA polymerase (family 10)